MRDRYAENPDAYGEGPDAQWIGRALHDLSQPLTALECCLYLGTMEPVDASPDERLREMRETVDQSLVQCRRVIDQVRALNERLALEAIATHGDSPP